MSFQSKIKLKNFETLSYSIDQVQSVNSSSKKESMKILDFLR